VTNNQLGERGRALEEEFFRTQSAELVAKLRAFPGEDLAREQMIAALGVDSSLLVEALIGAGVTEATLAAVALAPLVLVAWADGKMDPEERRMVMARAQASGVEDGGVEYVLLDNWLDHEPPETLMTTWTEFAREVIDCLDGEHRQTFCDAILRRAASVANAAGGFIGHRKVSGSERKRLEEIQAVLTP
jgi:tellurite resistance protein